MIDWAALISESARALFVFVLGGGVFSSFIAFRKDRRDAPKDTVATLEAMLSQAAQASSKAIEALSVAADSKKEAVAASHRASEAERRAAQAEKTVAVFRTILLGNVVHIIKWIDKGASPPPPTIQQELRDFVNEVTSAEQAMGQE